MRTPSPVESFYWIFGVTLALILGIGLFLVSSAARDKVTDGLHGQTCIEMTRHHDKVFGSTDTCTAYGATAPAVMPWLSNQDNRVTYGHAH